MAHKALCNRFGVGTTVSVGFVLPVGLSCVFALASGSDMKDALYLGAFAGYMGWNSGVFAEMLTNSYISGKKLGATESSKLVQKNQIMAYLAAASLILGGDLLFGKDEPKKASLPEEHNGQAVTKPKLPNMALNALPGVS